MPWRLLDSSVGTSEISEGVMLLLRFNLVRVEIRELRPEVVAKSDEVLVHYRSRTNVRQGLSIKTLA